MSAISRITLFILFIIATLSSCKKDPTEDPNTLIPPNTDPGPEVENTANIEGYCNKVAYFPGDEVHLMISSAVDSFVSVSLHRYGADRTQIFNVSDIPVTNQNYYRYSYSFGCDWDTTYSFELDKNLTSGMYSAVIKNSLGNTDFITFIVKQAPDEVRKPILVIASTNTWQAYNNWGGASFYKYNIDDGDEDSEIRHSVIVSFKRPNRNDSPERDKGHLAGAEAHLLRWLETEGYDYAMATDADIHGSDFQLENRKCVILNVHPEYYTEQMLDNIEQFNLDGGALIYLGGNGLYWKTGLSDDLQIECRKSGDSHRFADGTGGLWREKGRSPTLLVGSEYDNRGFGTYHPYEVLDDSHWVFNGTGLSNGDLFGTNSLNGGGASGHETDKRPDISPSVFKLLSVGTNPDDGGAEMLIREDSGRGLVFSVGSISYTGALSVDQNTAAITRNVLDKVLN